MIRLLLGEDIYAKQRFLDQLLQDSGSEIVQYRLDKNLPKLESLGGDSLFGSGTIHVFLNCLASYELPELEVAAKGSSSIIFVEDSLDKRLVKSKRLIEISEVIEFPAPSRDEASKWILQHAKDLGVSIQPTAANELTKRMLGQTKKILPVVAVHHELLKLFGYSGEGVITKEMVSELTPQDSAIDLFFLLDQIAQGNKRTAVELLHQYYSVGTEDEKAQTIKLVALLSEQLRGLWLVSELREQNLSDKEILSATGWKSGRLYILNKLSKNLGKTKIGQALSKLHALDKEVKTSTLPPRVIVDLIIASL